MDVLIMENKKLKKNIIDGFIDYYTSSEEKRTEMKQVSESFIEEYGYDEIREHYNNELMKAFEVDKL